MDVNEVNEPQPLYAKNFRVDLLINENKHLKEKIEIYKNIEKLLNRQYLDKCAEVDRLNYDISKNDTLNKQAG